MFGSTNPVFNTPVGQNVSIPCPCENLRCLEGNQLWIRFHLNGWIEHIDYDDTNKHRFTSDVSSGVPYLNLHETERGDSGRYYCGERSSYLEIQGQGNLLHVGEPAWTHQSNVMLLTEAASPEVEAEEDPGDIKHETPGWSATERNYTMTSLRCLVTELSSPTVKVLWKSSTNETKEGFVRKSEAIKIGGLYTVISWLDVKSYYILDNEEDMEEEWWCEVQHEYNGRTFSNKSNSFNVFLQKNKWMRGFPEWCEPVLYVSTLFGAAAVFLLIVLSALWVCRLERGAYTEQASQETGDSTVTYSQVSFNQSAKPGQSRDRPERNTDTQTYSDILYRES